MTASRIVSQRAASDAIEARPDGVTAVVCTFRGATFLDEQLTSIVRQSHPVDEIIVTDDGSDDDTLEIATRVLEASGLPYRVFTRDDALRIAGNAAFGIEAARTTFVALADQDDVWRDDKIATLLPLLVGDEQALVAHSDATLVDGAGRPLGATLFEALGPARREWREYRGDHQFAALLRRNLLTGATSLVRRDFALRAGVAPEPWIHDEWLAIAASLTNGIRVSEAPLISYRQHDRNQIGQRRLGVLDKVRRITEPGVERQRRKAERARVLAVTARRLGADAAQESSIRRKAAHEQRRAALPDARLRRIPSIVRAAITGRYTRYSRGVGDIARDLLQSHSDRGA